MADEITLSGTTFNVHPIGTNYKAKPGVYAFMRVRKDIWEIMYAGEADDLKSRLYTELEQHHRYDCAVTDGKSTHLATKIVPDGRKARLILETKLRNDYDPPCNRQ